MCQCCSPWVGVHDVARRIRCGASALTSARLRRDGRVVRRPAASVDGVPDRIVTNGFIEVNAWQRPRLGLDFNVDAARPHLREEDARFLRLTASGRDEHAGVLAHETQPFEADALEIEIERCLMRRVDELDEVLVGRGGQALEDAFARDRRHDEVIA